jgi:adenylate cyclase
MGIANVLIVDDQEMNLKAYRLTLEDSGMNLNIFTAKDENQAKEIIRKVSRLDVVLTDLVMLSEQSGMEVLRAAKQKDPLVMVIIITAFDEKLRRYQAYELGAFDCISKGTPGIKTADEIVFKTRNALQFRELALHQIENRERILFLKRYFDPGVFEVIEKNPDLLKPRSKIVTIVFWDIRGFSRLSEILKAHPTLIAEFLKEYFKAASGVIFEHRGVLDKFMGDGIMAIFGALNDNENEGYEDAARAVNAAIILNQSFNTLLDKWTKEWELYTPHKIDIGLGCGIHTGETLVGNLGTEIRDQYTALGPHVNFTQRIESITPKGKIWLSASTKVRVEKHFRLKQVDTMTNIKNIEGKFDIFEIAGTLNQTSSS